MNNRISRVSIAFLASIFVMTGCQAPPERDPEQKPAKTVIVYTLKKLNKDQTHKIASNNLKGVVSSGNGEHIYVVGHNQEGLSAYQVDNDKWVDALDWKKIQQASDHAAIDLSNQSVGAFSSFTEGIMFTVSNYQGLVVLKDTGVANSSHYPQTGIGNFKNGAFIPFMVTNNAKNQFVFLLAGDDKYAKNGILFRKYIEPPKNDNSATAPWDNSFTKILRPPTPLDQFNRARVQDKDKNLLLASKDGIFRLREADIGSSNKAFDNGGNPIFLLDTFKLDGATKNENINTMSLVDDRYLVVGLKSSNANNGGLAIADLNKNPPSWYHFGKGQGLSVDSIAVERIADRERTAISAVIATDKGLLFMGANGRIMPLIEGEDELFDYKAFNNIRAKTSDYDEAHSGFAGDRISASVSYIGGGQDKNGLWYLGFAGGDADDGGVYTLDVKSEQVNAPRAPPVLP